MRFTPRPYQSLIIEFILANLRCGVWAEMGLGKTVSTLTALVVLLWDKRVPVLVIAPKRVAMSTWPDEALKWDHLEHLVIVPIVGNKKERELAARRPADIYTINYEGLVWLRQYWGSAWPYRIVVADESTRLKSFRIRQGGKRARALAQVAWSKVERFIELTGTPAPNGLVDLWGQSWFLERGILGSSFEQFEERWFRRIQKGEDRFAFKLEPLSYAQAEIEDLLKPLTISLRSADWFDIAEPIHTVVPVDMPPDAAKLYKDMERELYLELLSGESVEAFNAASKSIKCLQIANGGIYTESGWEHIHSEKIAALESIIEEAAGMPVLCAYHFQSDLRMIQKAFPHARVIDNNPNTIRDWNAGKIELLVGHPDSCGHGLNLQYGSNRLVFFGHWWALEPYQQMIERIGPVRQAQAGLNRPVFIHHIVTRGTVDELVMASRNSKRQVQDLLMEAMKCKYS